MKLINTQLIEGLGQGALTYCKAVPGRHETCIATYWRLATLSGSPLALSGDLYSSPLSLPARLIENPHHWRSKFIRFVPFLRLSLRDNSVQKDRNLHGCIPIGMSPQNWDCQMPWSQSFSFPDGSTSVQIIVVSSSFLQRFQVFDARCKYYLLVSLKRTPCAGGGGGVNHILLPEAQILLPAIGALGEPCPRCPMPPHFGCCLLLGHPCNGEERDENWSQVTPSACLACRNPQHHPLKFLRWKAV